MQLHGFPKFQKKFLKTLAKPREYNWFWIGYSCPPYQASREQPGLHMRHSEVSRLALGCGGPQAQPGLCCRLGLFRAGVKLTEEIGGFVWPILSPVEEKDNFSATLCQCCSKLFSSHE